MKIRELLFTAFYSGYSPVAPGTAGTIVGMAVYFIEYRIFGTSSWVVNLVLVVLMLYPAKVLCDNGEEFFNKKDPPEVVIDEVMGYWVSVLFHPFSLKLAFAAFIIFRIIDILKPYPIKSIQSMKGGMGILIDDIVAGIYTNVILLCAVTFLRSYGVQL